MKPSSRASIVVNGKFLAAAPTGVHRVAHELLGALDDQLQRGAHELTVEILKPKDASDKTGLSQIRQRTVGTLTWQFWEQIDLPRSSRHRLLLNLCNLAPLAYSRAITMIHDAQVFSTPASYNHLFRRWYQFALPTIGRTSRLILTVSDYSKAELVRFGISSADKICVIHNGADHILRVQAEDSAADALALGARPFVLALANIQAHKNIRVLLEAFRRPPLAGVQLVLVGGADAARFRAAGLEVDDRVTFAGSVPDGVLKALMQRCSALAFPSLTEGFGLPPLEAMTLGRPVVVAPCGALPEVCGSAAAYVDPHDPQAWSETLAAIAADHSRSEAMGAAGREQASQFTWRAAASKLLAVMEEFS